MPFQEESGIAPVIIIPKNPTQTPTQSGPLRPLFHCRICSQKPPPRLVAPRSRSGIVPPPAPPPPSRQRGLRVADPHGRGPRGRSRGGDDPHPLRRNAGWRPPQGGPPITTTLSRLGRRFKFRPPPRLALQTHGHPQTHIAFQSLAPMPSCSFLPADTISPTAPPPSQALRIPGHRLTAAVGPPSPLLFRSLGFEAVPRPLLALWFCFVRFVTSACYVRKIREEKATDHRISCVTP